MADYNKCKYAKEEQMISYDDGKTWIKTGMIRRGSLIEYDSEDCMQVLYRWYKSDEYECVGSMKYPIEYYQVSKNGGATWENDFPVQKRVSSEPSEYGSTDCLVCDSVIKGGVKLRVTYVNGKYAPWTLECDNNPYVQSFCGGPQKYYEEPETVEIGECVEILSHNFAAYRTNLKEVKFPSSLKIILLSTFKETGLESVEFPPNIDIKYIGGETFYECRKLKEVKNIPYLPGYMFRYCSALTSVTLTDKVEYIGWGAFESCPLEKIELPPNVREIGDFAFDGCRSLQRVNIPDNVEYIGDCAFRNCTALKEIDIPDSVEFIGGSAFYYCSNVSSLRIPSKINSITNGLCWHMESLRHIDIPNNIIKIGTDAFRGCKSLVDVTLRDNLLYIGDAAFYGCGELQTITIPKTVEYIGYQAFHECEKLKSAFIMCETPPAMDKSIFNYSTIANIYVPSSSFEKYKDDPSWSQYSPLIRAM